MKSHQKEILRQQALTARRSLPVATRTRLSNIIQKRLLHHFNTSGSRWLVYRSMPDEVSTKRLFSTQSLHVFAPITHSTGHMEWRLINSDTQWDTGNLKVEEPRNGAIWQTDGSETMIVCPLLGFDRNGNRLGLGKGCFDRWLARYNGHISCRVGLAFSCQEFEHIPTEEHDMSLDFIVTEQELIACNTA